MYKYRLYVCAIWHRFQVSMKKCKGTAKCNEACFSVLQRGGSQSLCALEEEVYLCVQNERQPPHWSSGPVCLQGVSQEGTPVSGLVSSGDKLWVPKLLKKMKGTLDRSKTQSQLNFREISLSS